MLKGGLIMATTNLNIRTDKEIKNQIEKIFSELKLDMPNEVTATAIEEGRRIASDSSVKGNTSMEELKAALEA